jgi:large subunit ribosomal protein L32
MAVPKKRTSKAKTRARKANWVRKAKRQAEKALSLARSINSGNTNFIYTKG